MAYIEDTNLIEEIKSLKISVGGKDVFPDEAKESVLRVISEQPTADVEEVKHGKWLPQIVSGVKAWDCSECKTLGSPHWKRCPICEAKMDGGKAE